jgi:nucleoside-diphosphate-sugar epimerase
MKTALVTGASGLIGSHLVNRLKAEGYHVRGVSRHKPETTQADEYVEVDLRGVLPSDPMFKGVSEIYQFACEVGGLGYIASPANDVEMLRNSTMIDISICEAARHIKMLTKIPPKVFFASSACVYNVPGKRFYAESDAYPANCANAFAWQKLFAERLYQAYANTYGIDIRIGRLFNTYGIGMAWRGGREKSVAALCRKIAETKDGGIIDVWGNGSQTRSYTYVDDCIEGIWRLMQYPHPSAGEPLNIGPSSEVTIRDLIKAISKQASKSVFSRFGDGPVGVSKICSDNTRILEKLKWEPSTPLKYGLERVFPWIEKQVLDFKAKT